MSRMALGGESATQSQLLGYAATLRRRKWTVVLVTLLAAGAALAFSETQTPVYQASAQILLQPSATQQLLSNGTTASATPVNPEDEIARLESPSVAAIVQRQIGSVPGISASLVTGTDIIQVTAASTAATGAARIANAYASAYIAYRRTTTVNDLLAAEKIIQTQMTTVQGKINTLNAPPAPGATTNPATTSTQLSALEQQLGLLSTQLATLQSSIALGAAGAQVIQPASVPAAPSSPRKLRDTLLGFGTGLVLGVGLAFLRETLDDTIATREDLDRVLPELPVLAEIPNMSSRRGEKARVISAVLPHSPAAEAYRTLRTSVQFLSLEHSLRTLQVTSPRTGEGKTTTLANLAVALAGAGQRVIVIDADLRRPRMHELFGVENSIGFTSVLLGEAPLSAALQEVPGQAGLRLLTSGAKPSNPSELLASRRAAEVLASLAEAADLVLVDSPPVLPVTDAVALAPRMDATLVVVSAGTTTGRDLARTLETLGRVAAPVVGTVLNATTSQGHYPYYGYHYQRYSESSTSTRKSGAGRPG